jgi:hypothetical protein
MLQPIEPIGKSSTALQLTVADLRCFFGTKDPLSEMIRSCQSIPQIIE